MHVPECYEGGENGGSKGHRSNPPARSRSGPRSRGLTRTGDGVAGACHALSLIRFCCVPHELMEPDHANDED